MQPKPVNLESLPVLDAFPSASSGQATAPPIPAIRVSPAALRAHATLLLQSWPHLPPKIALAEVVAVLMNEYGVSDSRAMHNARIAQKRLESEKADRRKP